MVEYMKHIKFKGELIMNDHIKRLLAERELFSEEPLDLNIQEEWQTALETGETDKFTVKKEDSDIDIYHLYPKSPSFSKHTKELVKKLNQNAGFTFDTVKVSTSSLSKDSSSVFLFKKATCKLSFDENVITSNDIYLMI